MEGDQEDLESVAVRPLKLQRITMGGPNVKRLLATTTCMLAILSLASPASAENGVTDTTIKIGQTSPLSGQAAAVGIAHSLGTKLAVAEVNAAGGINGRKIELIDEDDAYVPSRGVQNIHKLVDVDQVFAITGTSSSGATLGSIDFLVKSPVILVNTFVANSAIWTPTRDNIFSIAQGYPRLAHDTVMYIDKKKPNAKWAAIVQDDEFGNNLIEGFNEAMKELKKEPVHVIRYKRGQKDFASEMLTLREKGATALFSGAISQENVSIAREARRLNMDIDPIGMMFTIHSDAVQELLGAPAQGAVFAEWTATLSEPLSANVVASVKKHFSADDGAKFNRMSLSAYSGVKVLFSAIDKCGKDVTKACVIGELEKTKDLETGAMGPISFGSGSRYSNQKTRILENDFKNRNFIAVTDFE